MEPKTITLDQALELLSLPRELGMHPEKQKPVLTNLGRFGPYVVCDGDFRSLKKEDNAFTITFDRAMELLREEKKQRRGAQALKEFGKHEEATIELMDGKYGMYLKWGDVNATVPKDADTDKMTLEQAVEIVKVRAEQVGAGTGGVIAGKGGKKGAKAPKKAGSEKPAAKKTAAKKAPPSAEAEADSPKKAAPKKPAKTKAAPKAK